MWTFTGHYDTHTSRSWTHCLHTWSWNVFWYPTLSHYLPVLQCEVVWRLLNHPGYSVLISFSFFRPFNLLFSCVVVSLWRSHMTQLCMCALSLGATGVTVSAGCTTQTRQLPRSDSSAFFLCHWLQIECFLMLFGAFFRPTRNDLLIQWFLYHH